MALTRSPRTGRGRSALIAAVYRSDAAILNVIAYHLRASLSTRAKERSSRDRRRPFRVDATGEPFGAVALTFALVQRSSRGRRVVGKARLMIVCLALLGAANIIGALATSFEMLFLSRILCGIAAGGTFPIAMGLTSDLVATEQRQVALGRILAGAMTGNLLGASAAGVIGDFLGWRGVLVVLGVLVIVAVAVALVGFRRGGVVSPRRGVPLCALKQATRHPRQSQARVCFTAVFIEGCAAHCSPSSPRSCSTSRDPGLDFPVRLAASRGAAVLHHERVRLLPRFGVKVLMIGGSW